MLNNVKLLLNYQHQLSTAICFKQSIAIVSSIAFWKNNYQQHVFSILDWSLLLFHSSTASTARGNHQHEHRWRVPRSSHLHPTKVINKSNYAVLVSYNGMIMICRLDTRRNEIIQLKRQTNMDVQISFNNQLTAQQFPTQYIPTQSISMHISYSIIIKLCS